jgi:SAM-dependent methyltransferase
VDRFGPEISDLIVDYDPLTLERRDVAKATVLDRLRERRALRIARTLDETGNVLDRAAVDGILVRSHLELQRLHEEFRVGALMRSLLVPMLDAIRRARPGRIRIVDLGCGIGFIVRWLAARGELGSDVDLIGADYNLALVGAAQRLAAAEQLPCRFVAGNAFALHEPATIYISTGVLHHFRGDDLAAVFSEHERQSEAIGFVHLDIRPSWVAPLGSWIFHRARMREPLAQFDGYWSTVRAHDAATLRTAAIGGAPGFAIGMIDARPGLRGLLRIFQATLGLRGGELGSTYASFGKRFYEGS